MLSWLFPVQNKRIAFAERRENVAPIPVVVWPHPYQVLLNRHPINYQVPLDRIVQKHD